MSNQYKFKGADDLTALCKMIRHIYVPMEGKNSDIVAMLENYAKILKDSVDQVTGSRAIEIPENIEPDEEKALSDPNTMEEYKTYLVSPQILNLLFSLFQAKNLFLKISFESILTCAFKITTKKI